MNKKEIIQICVAASILVVLLILLFSNLKSLSFRQIDDYIENGNEEFDDKKYDDAKIQYVGALSIDSLNTGALYNYANTDYQNGQFERADRSYAKAAQSAMRSNVTPDEKALESCIFHNKGNANMNRLTPLDSVVLINETIKQMEAAGQDASQLKQQFYNKLQQDLNTVQNPIKDYKDALRRSPENDSIRYNLAMAQDYEKKVLAILQTMTPPNNSNSDNKDQDKKDQEKQDQQQQQQQQQQQDEQEKQQQDQNQMAKENAEQILKALEQEEQELQKKRKVDQSDSRYQTDKDW